MNDKKKMMIIAALAVIMLGVGAFQFMGGSAKPEPVAKGTKTPPKLTTVSDPQTTPHATTPDPSGAINQDLTAVTSGNGTANGEVKTETGNGEAAVEMTVDPMLVAVERLSPRDPFNGVAWDLEATARTASQPVSTPTPRPQPVAIRRPRGLGSQTRPWEPGTGDIKLSGVGGGNEVAQQMPVYDEVPYKVTGVINGSRPAVVVSDNAGGSQRLVRVGSKLDPDTEVIGIQRGKMIVRKHGKVKTISIEEGAPAKAGGNSPEKK